MMSNDRGHQPADRDEDERVTRAIGTAGITAPADTGSERREVTVTGGGVERHERLIRSGTLERRERIVHDFVAERRAALLKLSQLVWLVVGIVEALIGLRVLLKLAAANPNNPFADFVYDASSLFLGPFFGLVSNPSTNGLVLEVSSLIAMIVYALAGWVLDRVIAWLLFDRPSARTVSVYEIERD